MKATIILNKCYINYEKINAFVSLEKLKFAVNEHFNVINTTKY